MLSRRKVLSLAFPKITYIKGGKIVWPARGNTDRVRRPKDIELYRLDWDAFEEDLRREDRAGWYVRRRPDLERPALPPRYEEMLRGATFAISPEYMLEVQRNAERAIDEWETDRPFDTIVREHCLEPAIAHVESAFYLLEDCLFDPERQYWLDHDSLEKQVMLEAMLIKFWTGQTGAGCVWGFARMDRLRAKEDVRLAEFVVDVSKWREGGGRGRRTRRAADPQEP